MTLCLSIGRNNGLVDFISEIFMRQSVSQAFVTAKQPVWRRNLPLVVGVAVISLLPAIFWTVAIVGLLHVFSITVPVATAALLGMAIAVFLASVCAPIMMRTGETRRD